MEGLNTILQTKKLLFLWTNFHNSKRYFQVLFTFFGHYLKTLQDTWIFTGLFQYHGKKTVFETIFHKILSTSFVFEWFHEIILQNVSKGIHYSYGLEWVQLFKNSV